MPPFVTVLMTVHNGLPYLSQAIESVLDQTFGDFEFLVIDDASTDNSVACIRSYEDSRIRLVCNERNLGQACSLNKGLELSRGAYVARLDQDDVCLPDRLRRQVSFLEQRPDVAVVGTWGYRVDSLGHKIDLWCGRVEDYGIFLALLLLGKCPVWHPSVMFRRDVVLEIGGYDESFAPAEDFDLWVKLALCRYGAGAITEPLVMYRIHAGQQSVSKATIQWSRAQRSHGRLVGAFCHGTETELLGELLRIEDSLWKKCQSKARLLAVLRSLAEMLMEMQIVLRLSNSEFASLNHRIYRRLGLGAKWGTTMGRWPSVLFYPIFFMLCPLLIPKVRPFLAYLVTELRRFPYMARTILNHYRSEICILL